MGILKPGIKNIVQEKFEQRNDIKQLSVMADYKKKLEKYLFCVCLCPLMASSTLELISLLLGNRGSEFDIFFGIQIKMFVQFKTYA